MSDIELAEVAKEENPSEPLPDVPGAAEPAQPAEPDESPPTSQVLQTQSSTSSALSVAQIEKEDALVHRSKSFASVELYKTKFTQTFFKYMKNLSDKRCVQIFNMEIDHENKSIKFYQKSMELLLE